MAEKKFHNKSIKPRTFFLILFVLLFIAIVAIIAKAGSVARQISPEAGIFSGLIKTIANDGVLDGEADGRINAALIGMRGAGVEGGGRLADTIMIASMTIGEKEDVEHKEYKGSLISIPRDLYVTIPGTDQTSKLNNVYNYGEREEPGGGFTYMRRMLEDITGQKIHYIITVNFKGFEQIVDELGGVEITRDKEFVEDKQFHVERVCDPQVFTVESGNFETKIDDRGKVVARYPLCYNADEECGGVFHVPAGTTVLSGEEALCYVRSRMSSSDFDRARRQQDVVTQLRSQMGTLGFFSIGKINGILNAIGSNARTDMEIWELERALELYRDAGDDFTIEQRVLDTTDQGLLKSIEDEEAGYILLPKAETYDEIRSLFRSTP